MTDLVLSKAALQDVLMKLITTEKVRVSERDGVIQLLPVRDNDSGDETFGIRGMFAGDPNMTVEKFLERKRADKEREL